MHFTSAIWSLFLLPAVLAAPTHSPRTSVTLETVGLFPNATWVENAAVRSNGQLLVTLLSTPAVYQVDPFHVQPPKLIQTIPGVTGLLGIAEVEPDVFAVVAGNLSLATVVSTPGSYSIWKIDVRTSQPTATKITDIPTAQFLNGMAVLDANGTVLVADSGAGAVYRVNTNTGENQVVITDPLMQPAVDAPFQLGINGIGIRGGYLYFTSSTQGLFARIAIRADGTPAAGAAAVVSRTGAVDDFAFGRNGAAYIATNLGNTLLEVTPAGNATVVAGDINSSVLAGATSARFGRTAADSSVLYVTIDGRFTNAAGNATFLPGKVLAVRGLQV
ncbi:hypothetical protein HWV62_36181 [Athelia sp. TMB]|nr:hypothetical protein HWV62_36181 [Athelia sp. TMB]